MKSFELNEQMMALGREKAAERYYDMFEEQMMALEASPLAKIRGITAFDVASLGEQLMQFQQYAQFVTESGSGVAGDLGHLPDIALDIITASYGASIVPMICSVQPIEEEQGTVYFKNTQAGTTRGNVTADQYLREGRAVPDVYAQGYAGEQVTSTLGSTTAADLDYNGTVNSKVRRNSIRVTCTVTFGGSTVALTGMDNGEGDILGKGFYGTMNYDTGAWTITFTEDPGTHTDALVMVWGSDFEAGQAVPMIHPVTESVSIRAEIFTLGTQLGLFKSYSLKKRFGKQASDEMIQDLTDELTAELGQSAIARLAAASPGSALTWNRNAYSTIGISWNDHKQQFKDIIGDAEALILNQAGRGTVTHLIAGSSAASLMSSLPGFVSSNITGTGPQFYGTLDGRAIIRSPQTAANTVVALYKGPGYFDAAAVYAPYMPLFVTNALPGPSDNMLMQRAVAAVWAGLQVVVPNYVATINITTS